MFGLFGFISFGQRTITGTIGGATAYNSTTMINPSAIQVLCTNVAGTSEGSMTLEASVDNTSWETITETAGYFHFWPNDTFTVLTTAVWLAEIKPGSFPYYRVHSTGGSGDTTTVTIKWTKERKWNN